MVRKTLSYSTNLWLTYDRKDRMEQRVTNKTIRHKNNYLNTNQLSHTSEQNKFLFTLSMCLHRPYSSSNCPAPQQQLCIYISHNLYFNNNNFYDTTHQMSIVYKSCYCLKMNTNFNFMPKKKN